MFWHFVMLMKNSIRSNSNFILSILWNWSESNMIILYNKTMIIKAERISRFSALVILTQGTLFKLLWPAYFSCFCCNLFCDPSPALPRAYLEGQVGMLSLLWTFHLSTWKFLWLLSCDINPEKSKIKMLQYQSLIYIHSFFLDQLCHISLYF